MSILYFLVLRDDDWCSEVFIAKMFFMWKGNFKSCCLSFWHVSYVYFFVLNNEWVCFNSIELFIRSKYWINSSSKPLNTMLEEAFFKFKSIMSSFLFKVNPSRDTYDIVNCLCKVLKASTVNRVSITIYKRSIILSSLIISWFDEVSSGWNHVNY